MDRRVTPPKWVTSPTWGPLPARKQALSFFRNLPQSSAGPFSAFLPLGDWSLVKKKARREKWEGNRRNSCLASFCP